MTDKISAFNNATGGLQQNMAMSRMRQRIMKDYGENSPVDNKLLPHVSKNIAVVLPEEVYKTLDMIADITNTHSFEVPFLLFGKYDYENNLFVFDDIEADKSVGDNQYEANASEYLEQKLGDFVRSVRRGDGHVIAHGHSHPPVGGYYTNFSIGDMDAYIKMLKNPGLKNITMICGCLLTGGNFNFVLCNSNGSDIYRIDNVFVEKKNGDYERLSAFGPDIRNIPRGRNMVR